MKKQFVIIGIVALLVCAGLSGCNQANDKLSPEEKRFIGTWKEFESIDNPVIYEFFSNGTVRASREEVIPIPGLPTQYYHTWELKDGKLVMTIPGYISSTLDYNFSYNDTFLTIAPSGTTDQNITFIKQ